jgi:hypothetical protein
LLIWALCENEPVTSIKDTQLHGGQMCDGLSHGFNLRNAVMLSLDNEDWMLYLLKPLTGAGLENDIMQCSLI